MPRSTGAERAGPIRAVHRLLPFVLTLVPGLGHLYIRQFGRGLVWLGVFTFTVLFLSGFSPILEAELPGAPVVGSIPGEPMAFVFPVAVFVLCLVDLYIFRRFVLA